MILIDFVFPAFCSSVSLLCLFLLPFHLLQELRGLWLSRKGNLLWQAFFVALGLQECVPPVDVEKVHPAWGLRMPRSPSALAKVATPQKKKRQSLEKGKKLATPEKSGNRTKRMKTSDLKMQGLGVEGVKECKAADFGQPHEMDTMLKPATKRRRLRHSRGDDIDVCAPVADKEEPDLLALGDPEDR